MRNRRLSLFVSTVGLAAVGSIACLPATGLFQRPFPLLILIVLATAMGSRTVRVSCLEMRVTPSDLFVFCALAGMAPIAAPLVALASVAGAELGPRRRRFSIRTVFNLGAVPLSVALAAAAFHALGGEAGTLGGLALPLLAAALVYPVANMALAATAMHLSTGRSWLAVCKQSMSWSVVLSVTSALVGAGLLLALRQVGWWGLAIGVLPTVPITAYIRAHRARAEKLAASSPGFEAGDSGGLPALG